MLGITTKEAMNALYTLANSPIDNYDNGREDRGQYCRYCSTKSIKDSVKCPNCGAPL